MSVMQQQERDGNDEEIVDVTDLPCWRYGDGQDHACWRCDPRGSRGLALLAVASTGAVVFSIVVLTDPLVPAPWRGWIGAVLLGVGSVGMLFLAWAHFRAPRS